MTDQYGTPSVPMAAFSAVEHLRAQIRAVNEAVGVVEAALCQLHAERAELERRCAEHQAQLQAAVERLKRAVGGK